MAALPFVAVAAAYAALVAWRERDLGGLWIGMEPGRTTEALHSTAELAQLVALALVVVLLVVARLVDADAWSQPGTWLLWGGPLLVLGAGALVVLGIVRRRGRTVGAAPAGKADEGDEW